MRIMRPRNTAALLLVAATAVTAFQFSLTPKRVKTSVLTSFSPPGAKLAETALKSAVLDAPASAGASMEDPLAEYVKAKGGSRIIRKVLIANNGMAATKSIMSMRRWAYLELGDEKAISFVRRRRRLARLGPASENPKLRALKAANIAFMGPPAPVMSVLGDKIAANILAQTAKVPSIPWSGSYGNPGDDGPLQARLQDDGTIPQDTFEAACVTTADEALAAAERVGYPVMLKASEGGGGKGIRMNKDATELAANFPSVEAEVPGSPIFIMQLMTGARHLEVQVVGDEHGNAVALNGRDCSTQRRFQKIFEEGPPTKPSGGIAQPDVFADMELKAKKLVQNIGYVGAGTVEYLYDAKTDEYFFLELNPRLQVEHPVTEGVTGVNLPATQLQVAMGIPLPNMPEFGHLFATATNREDARKAMVLALKELTVRGEIRNPVEYLVSLLETDDFKANNIDTSWLDGILAAKSINNKVDDAVVVASAAVFRAHETCKAARAEFEAALARGQFSTAALDALDDFDVDIVVSDVKYVVNVKRTGASSFSLSTNGGAAFAAKVREQPDGTLLANFGGVSRKLAGLEEPLGLRMVVDGATVFVPQAFDPSEVRSDVTGKIVRWLKDDGDGVAKGETFAEVEAMKMIMPLKAADAGKISTAVAAGSVIETGDLLANLELDDPSKARSISLFEGTQLDLPGLAATGDAATDALRAYEASVDTLSKAMDGYDAPGSSAEAAVGVFVDALRATGVFKLQIRDRAGAIGQKMPADLDATLAALAPLADLAAVWAGGPKGVAVDAVASLLEQFLAVEERFVGRADEDTAIREIVKGESGDAAASLLAHAKLGSRATLVNSVLRALPKLNALDGDAANAALKLSAQLERVAALETVGPAYAGVALAAGVSRLEANVPPFEARVDMMKADLKQALKDGALSAFAKNPKLGSLDRGVDVLTELFSDADAEIAAAAAEVYVKRMYSGHDILAMDVGANAAGAEARWWYKFRSEDRDAAPLRFGKLVLFDDADAACGGMPGVLDSYTADLKEGLAAHAAWAAANDDTTDLNTLHVMLKSSEADKDDASLIAQVEASLEQVQSQVGATLLRSVNILATDAPLYPRYFTFVNPACSGGAPGAFKEDPMRRGMRPTFYHLLELGTVEKNFKMTPVQTVNRDLRIYIGDDRAAKVPKLAAQSVFVRRVSHSTDLADGGAARLLDKALDALDMVMLDSRVKPTASGRIFINVIPEVVKDDGSPMDVARLEQVFKQVVGELLASRARRLLAARVDEIEIKFASRESESKVVSARCLGAWKSRADDVKELTGADLEIPDISSIVEAKELLLDDAAEHGVSTASTRPVGTNDVGMVGWTCAFKTPEYPEGREVVIVANDVTYQSGSFGVSEDDFFYKVTRYAASRGVPRLYISSNSGARIGLVEALKPLVGIKWVGDDPSKGLEYLYVSEADLKSLPEGSVDAKPANAAGHCELEAIIGAGDQVPDGIGVENLAGSGLIAGVTSRAYEETFTLSYVSGRSVGIGAYLNRLGQRIIQMKRGPMILTGFQALNKLLGKKVYTSQDQLGGPQVMVPNGVTHASVDDDYEGCQAIVNWLSYVPETASSPPSQLAVADPVDRKVTARPPADGTPYDVREILDNAEGTGLFDKGSFTETLAGWGKTVVAGRAKLGGIPFGVISVETRTVEAVVPADPANPDSREAVKPQAGQVCDVMEMYADPEARGGILEPPGICEVKFRSPDQVKVMHRTDPELIELDADPAGNADAIAAREAKLAPLPAGRRRAMVASGAATADAAATAEATAGLAFRNARIQTAKVGAERNAAAARHDSESPTRKRRVSGSSDDAA
ncbi:acetyl-CoA carboxylase [Aureococcus anophagefferens]|nr:acetyl-CoA carboxylase [Aureococcus anophagefferens]